MEKNSNKEKIIISDGSINWNFTKTVNEHGNMLHRFIVPRYFKKIKSYPAAALTF